ncbi:MAG: CoA pyrophosphatase [Deltaproteobacteria bacterium]|nr:CoA pyrophosphatase [Deltaproteobacteria bacterium]
MKQGDFNLLKKKLPEFPGIQGKEKYFNSVVLVPLVLIDGEYHFLFQKRAAHIRQGGEICFPGGRHDPKCDLTYKETAIRETVEEIGIKREKIKIHGNLDTLIALIGATVDAFIATLEIKSPDELTPQKDEVEKLFTLPVSFFERNEPEKYSVRSEIQSSYMDQNGEKVVLLPTEALNLPERYAESWGFRRHRILVYNTRETPIWGITAEIIYEIIQKIRCRS